LFLVISTTFKKYRISIVFGQYVVRHFLSQFQYPNITVPRSGYRSLSTYICSGSVWMLINMASLRRCLLC